MAIYHLSIKIISRGKGKSAVAAAAYRAGQKIKNEYDGVTHDYNRKGGITYTEILLPDHAPPEYKNRAVLWNAVEKIEKAKNSQLAREVEIALPVELSKEENINLVRDYVKKNFVEHGAISRKKFTYTFDHRSYERQGIDQIPTIHLGAAASQMEKRGIRTERGDINREIMVTNQQLRQLKARIVKLRSWLKEEQLNTEPSTLADVINNILARKDLTGKQSQNSKISNLKAAADMLNFLTENKIMNIPELNNKLTEMIDIKSRIGDELKPIERRLKTLNEHIRQTEIYQKHTQINRLYQNQKLKHKERYYEANRSELILFEAAERYLKAHLNGRDKIPLSAWKAERDRLTADKTRLNRQYLVLKEETANVEKIRKNVNDIMRAESKVKQRTKAHDIDK